MLDFLILYLLLVLGLGIYFIVKDYESTPSDNSTNNQQSNSNNGENIQRVSSEEDNNKNITTQNQKFLDMDSINFTTNTINLENSKSKKTKKISKIRVKETKNNKRQPSEMRKISQSNSFNTKGIQKISKTSKSLITKNEINQAEINKDLSNSLIKLNTSINIEFINESHEYYVNGKKVISVTELIDKYSNHLGIYNDYAKIPDYVLRRAAIKGEALHKEIEYFEKSGKESNSLEFLNYKKIKKKLNFKVKHSEIMVAIKNSKGEFVAAGRLDMLVKFGSSVGIIDVKRTWKYYSDKVTAQVNLYKLGLQHTYGVNATELHCIRLREAIAENHSIKNDEPRILKVLDLI